MRFDFCRIPLHDTRSESLHPVHIGLLYRCSCFQCPQRFSPVKWQTFLGMSIKDGRKLQVFCIGKFSTHAFLEHDVTLKVNMLLERWNFILINLFRIFTDFNASIFNASNVKFKEKPTLHSQLKRNMLQF